MTAKSTDRAKEKSLPKLQEKMPEKAAPKTQLLFCLRDCQVSDRQKIRFVGRGEVLAKSAGLVYPEKCFKAL